MIETWWVVRNDVGQYLVAAVYATRLGFCPKWLTDYHAAILFPSAKSAWRAGRAAVHSGARVFRRNIKYSAGVDSES